MRTRFRLLAVGAAAFLSAVPLGAAETFTFKADSMTGSKAAGQELTVLEGRAEVVSGSLTVTADRIELSGADYRFLDCSGSVTALDSEKGVFLRTDRLRYDRKRKIVRLEGDSVLEDKKNSVVAKGRFIEYNDGADLVLLEVGVRILKDDMVCRSEYALYRRESEELELSGFPSVFKGGDEFRADRMTVNLDTKDISMVGAVSGSIEGAGDGKSE